MSKEPSPTTLTAESPLGPIQLPSKMPAESSVESSPRQIKSHSEPSSPLEPFPELDLEIGAEPNPSPTFAHEADMCASPAALSLPGPAYQRAREGDTGAVIRARVTWAERHESAEEGGDMKEATARALEWAKKMFGKDAERGEEDGEESRQGDAE